MLSQMSGYPSFHGWVIFVVIVQLLSHVRLFATPWTAACWASLSFTICRTLLKFISIESVMPSSHLILCRPLLLLLPTPPSIRVFSNESTLRMRWPKYWSFSFSIIPSKEIPGLSSFSMDWLDLLAVQGILKSLLQHHSSKASILQCSAFFTWFIGISNHHTVYFKCIQFYFSVILNIAKGKRKMNSWTKDKRQTVIFKIKLVQARYWDIYLLLNIQRESEAQKN